MYKIMVKSSYGTEEIDTADTKKEAKFLVGEYKLVYGARCRVWYTK